MLIVGVTGGIASGKSLVAKILKDSGAHLIDADRIVHELLMPDQKAWEEVLEYFGSGIQSPDGTIDRRKLGELVFNDPDKRAWLNSCLHPKVFAEYTSQVKHLCDRTPECIVIFDAALLIETGYHRKMDMTIVVYANQEQQLERLMSRNMLTREQALSRIRSQMPLEEKRGHADYVIDNTGSRQETERQAQELFVRIKREAERT